MRAPLDTSARLYALLLLFFPRATRERDGGDRVRLFEAQLARRDCGYGCGPLSMPRGMERRNGSRRGRAPEFVAPEAAASLHEAWTC